MVDGSAAGKTARITGTRVVQVGDEHLPPLACFIRQVWDPNATVEGIGRARAAAAVDNPGARGRPPPTFLLLSEGRPLGHVTTIPVRLQVTDRVLSAHWLKGLMVLPEHRNGPVGFLVLREAVGQLDTAMALVVEPAPRRLFEALGFQDLGPIPNYVRLLDPAAVARSLDPRALGLRRSPAVNLGLKLLRKAPTARVFGALGSWAARAWVARTPTGAGLRTDSPDSVDPAEVDDLWCSVQSRIPATPVRDGRHLAWRYDTRQGARYRLATVRTDSNLVGLAVVKRPGRKADPRLRGIRVAVLSEILFPPDHADAALATVSAAEQVARDFGAHALLCSVTHPTVRKALTGRAFLRFPGNVHLLVRDGKEGAVLPRTLSEWWITRGDSDADEVF